MLITKEVTITIVSKNINHFNNLGYNVNYGDIIRVNISDVSKSSHCRVKVKCDVCGEEKEKLYKEYVIHHSNQNFDACQKCKTIKTKKTNLKKYGVEHVLQNEKIKNKIKETMMEKYGVENSAYSEIIKEKTKNTIREKYGVEYITQSNEFKTASKKTKKERYGNENFTNFEQIKKTKKEIYGDEYYNNREKSNETCLEKYGVENVSQNEEIKERKKETNLKNWGVESPLQSDIVIKKLNITCMEKYGSTHPVGSKIIIDKIAQTNINNGRWLKIEDRSDFYKYYLLVCSQTLKNKKQLLESWNGNDYYTDEYILENFNLDSNDKRYPTIDHKKSIRYGFDNKIPVEEISNINNLCITTRSNNSSKGEKIEENFNI